CRFVASIGDRSSNLANFIDVIVCAALRDFHIWRIQVLAYDRAARLLLGIEAALAQQHDWSVDAGKAVGHAIPSGIRPCRCRLTAHVANIAAGIRAGLDIEHDPSELDLYDIAELGCFAAFMSVHRMLLCS